MSVEGNIFTDDGKWNVLLLVILVLECLLMCILRVVCTLRLSLFPSV